MVKVRMQFRHKCQKKRLILGILPQCSVSLLVFE